jgi:hypothetical protein
VADRDAWSLTVESKEVAQIGAEFVRSKVALEGLALERLARRRLALRRVVRRRLALR